MGGDYFLINLNSQLYFLPCALLRSRSLRVLSTFIFSTTSNSFIFLRVSIILRHLWEWCSSPRQCASPPSILTLCTHSFFSNFTSCRYSARCVLSSSQVCPIQNLRQWVQKMLTTLDLAIWSVSQTAVPVLKNYVQRMFLLLSLQRKGNLVKVQCYSPFGLLI